MEKHQEGQAAAPAETGFNDEVLRIAGDVLESGAFEKALREKIVGAFDRAINDSFKWGDLSRAVEGRIKEVLVPYIEGYDMSRYVVKLDEILSQVAEHTALNENRKILENFESLMASPPSDSVSLEDVFKRYCEFVAANVDTSDLEVVFDDGPAYESVTAIAEIVRDDDDYRSISSFDYATLYLHVEDSDELGFAVRLSRWKSDRSEGYDISYDMEPSIPGLAKMSGFDAYLCSLSRFRAKLTFDKESLDDDVTPDKEPEPDFR